MNVELSVLRFIRGMVATAILGCVVLMLWFPGGPPCRHAYDAPVPGAAVCVPETIGG